MNSRDPSDDELAPLLRIGLEDGGDDPASASHSQSWEPPSVEELQRALPQYEISGFIARGGMGAVYRGTQKALGRTVAIKVLPPGIDDGDRQFVARFRQEAQTMARLSHPNIVTVYEAGEVQGSPLAPREAHSASAEGERAIGPGDALAGESARLISQERDGYRAPRLLYFVMEFIDGTDVGQLVASEGMVEPSRAIEITSAVCEALAFAHGEGVIHRDIKPSNIMLDRKGRVKVADFGLAKTAIVDQALHTGTDVAMGTPDFVAPEALIAGTQVDQRADIYAVGVMLYQMLTGQVPRGRFASPSSMAPQVDKRLDAVVDKSLQTNREQRYRTATEMKTDVDAAQTPLPDAERGTRNAESKTARTRVAAIVAAGFVLASAAVFFFWEKINPSRAARAAESSPALQRAEPSSAIGRPDGLKPGTTLLTATKDAPFVNTLGMKFVPVPIVGGPTGGQRVLFSVWDTRVQDYATFATETKRDWQKPEFEQGRNHPAVYVSWDDATAFCAWLTERERKAGRVGANERYRLPSDHEWSCAVGIGAREDAAKLPSEKNGIITDAFPWGDQWPPPKGPGNYRVKDSQPDDVFTFTSPVGSFAPNSFGLYDLGGNVRQWCEDWFDREQTDRVLRGASWNGYVKERDNLLSSIRKHNPPTRPGHSDGFRCVLESSPATRTDAKP